MPQATSKVVITPQRPLTKLLWPICFSPSPGEKSTPTVIQKRCIEKNPSLIQKMTYLSLGGLITTIIGLTTNIFGFIKQNSALKWIGGVLGFIGIEAFVSGLFGGIDLSKKAKEAAIKLQKKEEKSDPEEFFSKLKNLQTDKPLTSAIQDLINDYKDVEQEIIKECVELILYQNMQDEKFKEKVQTTLRVIGLAKQIPELISQAGNSNAYIRIWAVDELGVSSDRNKSIDDLLLDISEKDGDPDIRTFSAVSLVKRGNKNHIQNLLKCIKECDANPYTVITATNTLLQEIQKHTALEALNYIETLDPNSYKGELKIVGDRLRESKNILIEKTRKEFLQDLKSKTVEDLTDKYSKCTLEAAKVIIPECRKLKNDEKYKASKCLQSIDDKIKIDFFFTEEGIQLLSTISRHKEDPLIIIDEIIRLKNETDITRILLKKLQDQSKAYECWVAIKLLSYIGNEKSVEPLINTIRSLTKQLSQNKNASNPAILHTLNAAASTLGFIAVEDKAGDTKPIHKLNQQTEEKIIHALTPLLHIHEGHVSKTATTVIYRIGPTQNQTSTTNQVDLDVSKPKEDPKSQIKEAAKAATKAASRVEKSLKPPATIKQTSTSPKEILKRELITKLGRHDVSLNGFLERNKYKTYDVKYPLIEIAKDSQAKESTRINAIYLLGEIGMDYAKKVLDQILNIDNNDNVKQAAVKAKRRIQERITDSSEKKKKLFIDSLNETIKVGRIVDKAQREELLKSTNSEGFLPHLKSLLGEIIFSTYENFDYFPIKTSLNPIRFDDFQREAIYLLGIIGDEESISILNKAKLLENGNKDSLIYMYANNVLNQLNPKSTMAREPQVKSSTSTTTQVAELQKVKNNELPKLDQEEVIDGIIEEYEKVREEEEEEIRQLKEKHKDIKVRKKTEGIAFSEALRKYAQKIKLPQEKIVKSLGLNLTLDLLGLAAKRYGIENLTY